MSSISTMSDEEKRARLKTVLSLTGISYAVSQAIQHKIANLENRLKSEKFTYNKKIIKTQILELHGQIDELVHQYRLMAIERDLLEDDIGLEII
jgi:hypothetical protein